MTDPQLLPLLQQTMQGLGDQYQDAARQVFNETGLQAPDWFVSFIAYAREPEPITLEFYSSLFPYNNPETLKEGLAQTVSRGFLKSGGPAEYRLTVQGRHAMARFFQATAAALSTIEAPLPAADLKRLADLLRRVVEATATNGPTIKPRFDASRKTDPGDKAAPLVRIDQYITDLIHYRDDAHNAAWQPIGLEGAARDTFTLVWRGDARTLADVIERTRQRGYAEEVYAAALKTLVQRGWLTEADGLYRTTGEGYKLRIEVEEATDRHHFSGWAALHEDEAEELKQLLVRLRDSLNTSTAQRLTETYSDLYELSGKVSQGIYTLTRSAVNPAVAEVGLNRPGLYYNLYVAIALDPTPLTLEQARRRAPYTDDKIYEAQLQALVESGWLDRKQAEYTLTPQGRSVLQQVLDVFYNRVAELDQMLSERLSPAEIERAAELLSRITTNSRRAQLPLEPFNTRTLNKAAPKDAAPALIKIDQALDELSAFRDDAHIATWQEHNLAAHAWELFTYLWRGDISNSTEMVEKAANRGHSVEDYQSALNDLIGRDWIELAGADTYRVTTQGWQARERSEHETDRYFYGPWRQLSDAETSELRDLLTRLEAELQQLAEAVTA
jgi:DNA-binding HxlR family transcriptional regulator